MNLFYQHVFSFCATRNMFSQHESLFLASHIFFVATTYSFVTHIIFVGNVTSMSNIFFVGTTFFCATHTGCELKEYR